MPTEMNDTLAGRRKLRWTIRRLLLITTCVAVLIASMNAFPTFFAFAFAICFMFSPSIVIAAVAIMFSNNRDRTIAFQIPVPVLAPLLTPPMMATFSRPLTYWEDIYMGLQGMGMIGGGLSLLGVILDLAIRYTQSCRAEPSVPERI